MIKKLMELVDVVNHSPILHTEGDLKGITALKRMIEVWPNLVKVVELADNLSNTVGDEQIELRMAIHRLRHIV